MATEHADYRMSRDDGEPREEDLKWREETAEDEWDPAEAWHNAPVRSTAALAGEPLQPMRRLDGWPQFLKHDIHLELVDDAMDRAVPISLDHGGPAGSLDDGGEAPHIDESATLAGGGFFVRHGRPTLPPDRSAALAIGPATRLAPNGCLQSEGYPPVATSSAVARTDDLGRGLPGRQCYYWS